MRHYSAFTDMCHDTRVEGIFQGKVSFRWVHRTLMLKQKETPNNFRYGRHASQRCSALLAQFVAGKAYRRRDNSFHMSIQFHFRALARCEPSSNSYRVKIQTK